MGKSGWRGGEKGCVRSESVMEPFLAGLLYIYDAYDNSSKGAGGTNFMFSDFVFVHLTRYDGFKRARRVNEICIVED